MKKPLTQYLIEYHSVIYGNCSAGYYNGWAAAQEQIQKMTKLEPYHLTYASTVFISISPVGDILWGYDQDLINSITLKMIEEEV